MALDELLREARIELELANRAIIEGRDSITSLNYETLCNKARESRAVVRWLAERIARGSM